MKISKRMLFGIIAIILAVVLVFVGIPLVNRANNTQTTVIRAVKPIPKGMVITEDQLAIVKVSASSIPSGSLQNSTEILGKYAMVDICIGDYITPEKLSVSKQDNISELTTLKDGQVAVSISAPSLSGMLANAIKKGDIIKIYHVRTAHDGGLQEFYELQYLMVIDVTNADGISMDEVTTEQSHMAATYTFAVTYAQAERLMQINAEGKMHFVLVSRGDPERSEKLLAKQNAILELISDKNFKKENFNFDAWETAWESEWDEAHVVREAPKDKNKIESSTEGTDHAK